MNKEIQDRWVAALRSGDYTQGRNFLNNRGKFCCLGVLCDLAEKEGVVGSCLIPSDSGFGGCVAYGKNADASGSTGILPEEVMRWANIGSHTGQFETEEGVEYSLSGLNDHGNLSFEEIADVIEKHGAKL